MAAAGGTPASDSAGSLRCARAVHRRFPARCGAGRAHMQPGPESAHPSVSVSTGTPSSSHSSVKDWPTCTSGCSTDTCTRSTVPASPRLGLWLIGLLQAAWAGSQRSCDRHDGVKIAQSPLCIQAGGRRRRQHAQRPLQHEALARPEARCHPAVSAGSLVGTAPTSETSRARSLQHNLPERNLLMAAVRLAWRRQQGRRPQGRAIRLPAPVSSLQTLGLNR